MTQCQQFHTVINNPSISKESVISRASEISPPLSLMNLLLTYATCFLFMMGEITLFKWLSSTFEISFISTFRSEIGRQFLINLLSLSFFSINFRIACFWEVVGNCVQFQQNKSRKMTWNFTISFHCKRTIATELKLQKQHIKHTKTWSFLLPTVPFLAVFQQ